MALTLMPIYAVMAGAACKIRVESSDMIKAMKSINSSAFRNATWDYISGTSEFKDIMDEILADDIVGINLYDERPPYVSGKSYKGHSTHMIIFFFRILGEPPIILMSIKVIFFMMDFIVMRIPAQLCTEAFI